MVPAYRTTFQMPTITLHLRSMLSQHNNLWANWVAWKQKGLRTHPFLQQQKESKLFKISEEEFVKWICIAFAYLVLIMVLLMTLPGKANSHEITSQEEFECLAKNIYFEARGEEILGQYAVGLVTLNRVESDRFPDTVCGVVKQAKYWNNNPIRNKCHFSWYCDGKSDEPKDIVAWTKAKSIAEMLLLFHVEDFTNGATHYHAPYVSPFWSKEKKVAAIIGGHIFYD